MHERGYIGMTRLLVLRAGDSGRTPSKALYPWQRSRYLHQTAAYIEIYEYTIDNLSAYKISRFYAE